MSTQTATCARCGIQLSAGLSGTCPKCLLESELPPARIGNVLELHEEIGGGGMGTVFRAVHLRLGRPVAVKFLSSALAGDPEVQARFEREARLLARLSHPNIVQVHDFGEEGEQSYIVMEYVDGQPLSACLPIPTQRAIEIGVQVCDALAYAHREGVIHRDIKPENIMLDRAGNVKITDFGIARLARPDEPGWTLTAAQVALGTPHYLAPEVLRGAPPDPRADLYALGVVLYQAVTGKLPVGDFDPLPGRLDRIVRTALAPDPERRFATALEMRRALSALNLDSGTEELSAHERFWILGASALSVVAAALAIWAGLQSLTPRIVRAGDISPLTFGPSQRLPDGRIVSFARFETTPMLVAVAGLSIALVALGLLRRHWGEAGLDAPRPARPLRESRRVLLLGICSIALYAIYRWGEQEHPALLLTYIPVLGGLLELSTLFVFFTGMLQAWRTARPLSREPLLFAGIALALLPPIWEFSRFIGAWKP